MRFVHVFCAVVALGDKGEVVVQAGQSGVALRGVLGFVRPFGEGFPVIDPHIALEHFEARAHLMDAVIQRFEFGGLINHVLRCRHFAAIM
ncbi:hypothetical protein D9M71_195000 [compost metagenome]